MGCYTNIRYALSVVLCMEKQTLKTISPQQVFSQGDLTKIMKLGEALLLNIGISQRDLKDTCVTAPHSIRSSFIECCGPEFIYIPLFHEKTVQDVST